jgi:hypothetical protein
MLGVAEVGLSRSKYFLRRYILKQLIPLTFFGGLLASLLGLFWYDSLTAAEKEEADAKAEEIAMRLYKKSFAHLTTAQQKVVDGYVEHHFAS